ncbi:MAG: hypothetical protein MJ171_00880 [Clostridia bacterium]|nr:hypothetical protein [Clostridia bacterium]
MKKKMIKDVIPEGFTVSMALTDMIPVVFFGLTAFVTGLILHSPAAAAGAAVTFVSGFIKVVWKLIVALKKKNIWWMFIQMRMVMPLGFLVFLVGLVKGISEVPFNMILSSVTGMPQLVFFILGISGMILMSIFAVKLDSSNAKNNWIEQTVNGISQACFFLGVLLIYIR